MLLQHPDPAVRRELGARIPGLQARLAQLLAAYLMRATGTPTSADPHAPSHQGPPLINRFKPLVGRPMNTVEEVLQVAEGFIKTVTRCFAEKDKIAKEVMNWWIEIGFFRTNQPLPD